MFASKDLFFSKPSGYQISRSVRLRSSATAYFNRTLTTPTSQNIWTYSVWLKRGALTGYQNIGLSPTGQNTQLYFDTSSNALIWIVNTNTVFATTQVFRDSSAWYHIVLAFSGGAGSNKVRLYVNGVEVTSFSTDNRSTTTTSTINTAIAHGIGLYLNGSGNYFDGYLTEINFVDGQQLTPSSFGQTNTVTGVWQPLKYTGTYGTNGFYLNFSDNSNNTATTIGKDYSGNGNNWTPNNISVTAGVTYDSMLDVPTLFADGGNGRGNYCTLNPNIQRWGVPNSVFSNGNLSITTTNASSTFGFGTVSNSSGKWYYEVTVVAVGTNTPGIGVGDERLQNTVLTSEVAYLSNGQKEIAGTGTSYGATYTTNDVIGVAYDLDGGTVTFYKNGTSQGAISLSVTANILPYCSVILNANLAFNFGQRPFTYTPPTGFVALNTQNLPSPTISNGANYMAASTYTGTGSTQSIVNSGNNPAAITFQPDLVWIKGRSAISDNVLIDSVRGASVLLSSNQTAAESSATTIFSSINSNGFTVTGTSSATNQASETLVGWQWQAGKGSTSSNTSGSITSTVSVGATQGFSVVTYTGTGANATVGHGLGVAPKMIIVKQRNAARSWAVYHASLGNGGGVYLDATNAYSVDIAFWNNTSPTSSVFSIGTGTSVNVNTGTYVAYCFSAVAGYSAFGSYTGNGSTDGPFVYCGFRPRFVMAKSSSAVSDWTIVDTARDLTNLSTATLFPNGSSAEGTGFQLDITSNGFKLRSTGQNTNSATYIFAAFAENPYKLSLAR